MKKILLLFILFLQWNVFGQTYTTSTIAGGIDAGYIDANGTNARFTAATGIEYHNGELFVTEQTNPRVRIIDAAQNVTTYAGLGTNGHANGPALSSTFYGPVGIIRDNNGNIYIYM